MNSYTPLTYSRLVGAWHLTHIRAVSPDGTREAGRPAVVGLLIYTADGHFSATIQAPEELTGIGFGAYAGAAVIDGNHVTHHVTVGAEPVTAGTIQIRQATLTADPPTLTLSTNEQIALRELRMNRGDRRTAGRRDLQ